MVAEKSKPSTAKASIQHSYKPSQGFSQSGFDLVERIYQENDKRDFASQQNRSFNEDLGNHSHLSSVKHNESMEDMRHENKELRKEMSRLSDKLDNIRRLQEMGLLNSFRK